MLTCVKRFGNSIGTNYFWGMQERHYKTILYFISVVILGTLLIQVYWNYKNYQSEKQQLVNDVQVSLDNAVSQYYELKASNETFNFLSKWSSPDSISSSISFSKSFTTKNKMMIISDTIKSIDFITNPFKTERSLDTIINLGRLQIDGDSLNRQFSYSHHDSLRSNALKNLTSQIIISLEDENIDPHRMDSIITSELSRKKIDIDHQFSLTDLDVPDSLETQKYDIITKAKSHLLPRGSKLQIGFENITLLVLKRNLIGILISTTLIVTIISMLMYLLHIIKQQKHLAEIKNDFISNISHEFKTPIATIGVAMESIQHFNDTNDTKKTKKYVDISSEQVGKLNTMVERLLETATLDSEALRLNKQETNIVEILESIHQKYKATQLDKDIYFESQDDNIWIPIDAFHIENAIDNIVDNAIKYGGKRIGITIQKLTSNVHIAISDSGRELTKMHTSQIFEKFYRIPKGNTHDVKGFGIGLYYTKTIIDKHEGKIHVTSDPTVFNIYLPYA